MRRQAESLAMHDRDPLGLEQVAREILVILDLATLRGALADQPGTGGIDVERALGSWAMQPRDLVQQIDDEVAPLLEYRGVLRDEVLRPVERLDRRRLADRARVGGRVRLDRAHRLDQ